MLFSYNVRMNLKTIFSYKYILYAAATITSCTLVFLASDAENAYTSSRVLANLAVLFLYISLITSALNANIKMYPGKIWLVNYRKAHGITAFLLAAGHGFVAFVYLVGGLSGFFESYFQYQMFLAAGIIAMDILFVMFLTSRSSGMRMLGIWWKRLHRLVYLSGVLIIAHAVMMRIYFGTIADPISIISLVLFAILLVLQLIRFYKYLNRKKPKIQKPNAPVQPINPVQTTQTSL